MEDKPRHENSQNLDNSCSGIDTELKKAQEQLEESEGRYKSLFDNNHSVMLLIDPETGNIVDANPAAQSFYGYSHEEITQKKISAINQLSKKDLEKAIDIAKKQKRRHFQFPHRLASGEIRQVEVYSGPIRFSGKAYLYSIVHDITEAKRNEQATLEKEKLSAVVKTASAICHEMNQPLMVILGFTELLEEELASGEVQASSVKEIRKQVERLGTITKKLMNITQFKTKGYLTSEILDIDAASLIGDPDTN